MSIVWGPWEDSGGNGMRIGVEATSAGVNNTSTQWVLTLKIYTENRYRYDDPQTITVTGGGAGTVNYTNSSSGGAVLRSTRTYTYTYPSGSYGTSPGTVGMTATVSGAYNGVTPSVSGRWTIAPRPYAAPAAPSGVGAVRNSDSQATVSWTRNATTAKPYTSLTVQMRTYTGGYWFPWQTVATVSGTATSYVKTGLSANHAYEFQVRANNSAGSSAFVDSPNVYTTPAAPSLVDSSINTAGTQITTTWQNNHFSYTGITLRVERSVNGAAFAQVASGLTYNTTSWTDTAPGAGNNQYRVRAYNSSGGLYSAYGTGDVVTTVVPPLAPTLLSPNGTKVDFTKAVTLNWKHNPGTDKAAQSAFLLQYSSNGGSTWAALNGAGTSSATSSYTIPANTLVNGTTYQWRVQTRGATSGGYGPYSAAATFTGASTPTVTIYPAGTSTFTRYNLVANPSVEVDLTGYTAKDANTTLSRDTTFKSRGTASIKATITTLATYNGLYGDLIPVEGGQTYGLRAGMASSVAGVDLGVTFRWADAAGAFISYSDPDPAVDNVTASAANTFYSVGYTAVAPDNAASLRPYYQIRNAGAAAGTNVSLWVDGMMVTPLGTGDIFDKTDYFDGSWADTTDTDYAWVGAANASASTANYLSGSDGTDTVHQLPLVMSWAYNQDEGALQAGWEARLFADDGVTLLESQAGSGLGTTVVWAYPVEDSKNYITEIRAQASNGLWSTRISRVAVIRLPRPAASYVAPEYQPCTGTMVLHLTADVPAGTKSRTNLCTNPSFEVDLNGWGNSIFGATACTLSRVTTRSTSGTTSMRIQWPNSGAGGSGTQYSMAVTVGQPITVSMDVYVPAGSPAVRVGDVFGSGTWSTKTDQWERVSYTYTPTSTPVYLGATTTNTTVGQEAYIDSVLIEQAPAPAGGYFDGSSANYLGTVYAWTGTAHASTSTETFTAEGTVDHVIVERRAGDGEWVTLASDVPVPSDLIDPLPLTNGPNEYRVTSVSSAPSYLVNPPVEAQGTDGQGPYGSCDLWAFVSYGPGFNQVLRVHSNLDISSKGSRVRAAQAFLGRKKPVLMVGQNVAREVSVKGTLYYNDFVRSTDPCRYDSPPEDWEAASIEADIVCYRDYTGRRIFGMISDVDASQVRWPSHASVSFSVTEVDYTEAYGDAVGVVDA